MESPSMLTVATVPINHITEIHMHEVGDAHLSGLEGTPVHIILTALRMGYRIAIPEDKEWGRLKSDGNWSGIIGMIQRGEADLGFNFLRMSEQRAQVVDFSRTYSIEGLNFVSQAPVTKASIFAYLYPFEINIWAAILSSLVLLSIFSKVLDRHSSCGHNFFKLFSGILQQSLEMGDGTLKWKFFIGCWSFFALVISSSYSAALLSFLTVPLREQAIENFHQLSQAVQRGTHKCYSFKGSSQVPELLSSNSQNRILGEFIDRNNWYNSILEGGSGRLINSHSSMLYSRLSSELLFGPYQDKKVVSKEVICVSPVGIALSKTFCCKKKLNSIISRLASAGIYEKFLRDHSLKISFGRDSDASTQSTIKQLSLKDMSGCFILLLIGLMSASIALLGEIIFFYTCKYWNIFLK